MYPRLQIREHRTVNLKGGYLIDGFPSVGFSSAIATESLINTSQFDPIGVIDSDVFPPISVIKDGKPTFPTRIFVNEKLKVSIFLSYLTLEQPLHRTTAETMLHWAKKQQIKLIVSSVAVQSLNDEEPIMGIGSTSAARASIEGIGLKVLEHGTVPGIPGVLLNEASISNQDVVVIVFHTSATGPDFKSSAKLCLAISKLIPGVACDINLLQQEAKRAEEMIRSADIESKHLRDAMYR